MGVFHRFQILQIVPNRAAHHIWSRRTILAVGTICLNRLGGCNMNDNKPLQKSGRGSVDYRMDINSGIIMVKWVDNIVVQLVSNFCGIEPMSKILRWCK